MTKKITLLIMLLCFGFTFARAQNVTVKGVVNDSQGQPLPGVSVVLKSDKKVATSTGISGGYSISVPANGTLVFSFVGYASQEIPVNNQSSVNVRLSDDVTNLSEVVVVGYGTQKKSVVTGAISSVKAADLETMPINRVEQALQGRTSGLTIAAGNGQPGTSSTVRLRGYTTYSGSGNNDPLWVIDGVIVDNGGIGYLNQNDIESIEVLKDAASQAIYGARAANGVIIISTKKGKSGKLQINYNTFYGTSSPAKKLDLLNATEYATIRNESALAAGKAAPYATPSTYGVGTDWQSLIFNDNTARQSHEFSVAGGNEKLNFYSSFGLIDQDGIVATEISKWKRSNVRINSTFKPAKWISFGENMGYSHAKNSSLGNTNSEFGGPLSSAINLDPITPAVETNPALIAASPYILPNVLRDANGNPYGISSAVGQEMSNPLAYIRTRLGNYSWDHNVVGNVFADIEPYKNVKFRSSLGSKIAFYGGEGYTPLYYLNSSSTNTKTQFNRSINSVFAYNFENTLSYTRSFGKHNGMLLVGQGVYMDNDTKSLNVNFANVIATNFDQANLNYKPVAGDRTADGGDGTFHKVNSLFSRLTYNYDEKYLVTALIRRDGSSRFGANNKYGVFPSFSLGWVPTRETFWPENKVVNTLKIRGGYGVTGNDVIGDFAYVSLVGSGRNYTFGTTDASTIGWSPAAASNPDLKWEETRQTNIGFDATLFTNMTFTVDFYKKETVGILQTPPVPAYLGVGGSAQNVGAMQNTGVEFELGYRKKIGDFNLGLNGNSSFLKNKVTKLLPGILFIQDNAASFQTMGNFTRTGLGRSFNEYFGYEMLGIFQTQTEVDTYVGPNGTSKLQPSAKPGDIKFANLNGDNAIDANDRTYLGSPIPKMTYGLTLNLGYKAFDMVAFGNGVTGNKIFQGLRRLDVTYANYQKEILERWTPTNPSNTMPRVVETDPNGNNTKFSKRYLEDGSYFRLKTFQLGYTLPKTLTIKAGMNRVRVYAMSENLFTATKYTGYDPEIGGTVFSVDRGVYPQARSFMLGLNVGF
ncbi:SusC/RagA family TonB-linked outer membrane protein [Hufsiella ginkgonis]|uniref:SusC/RagA family TonB-linked outer membrane protein n=1 Tax=Hufsiella ginkgonis TaxID=2695274 RepID=A0A7K1Y1H4_9SPHI|nr:TonB-dependent receptor [Hufsiella ginkgonis]MXV17095.1 SusC/RagA family TonB-linked outer membrane protein [Hufsiella ginkgonis]